MNDYAREKEIAIQAIKQAAVVCRAVQSEITPEVLEKKDKSPVTVADFASQALVCCLLETAFPNDPVIGEEDSTGLENSDNKALFDRLVTHVQNRVPNATPKAIVSWIDRGGQSDYCNRFWTLDPIDGTKGFLRKEQYAVSLALVVNGEIVVGALACPNLPAEGTELSNIGTGFIAVKGQGAYQFSLDDSSDPISISASSQEDPTQIRFCESVEKAHSSHSDSARIADALQITAEPVRLDSQAKYAVVARGDAEAYLRLPRDGAYREKIWDHAGGVLVVEETGGKVTDITGKPLDFTHGKTLANNRGVIVTNGIHHDAIIKTISDLKIGKF